MAQTRSWLNSRASGAGMHARFLLRASFRSSAHPACLGGAAAETRFQAQTATSGAPTATASSASGTGGGSRSSSNNRNFILYPAAAVVALTSVAAAKASQQPVVVEGQHQQSSLLDAQWVQQIPQQQNVLQVLSAQTIETHPLLTRDHIVRSPCVAGVLANCCNNLMQHAAGMFSSRPFCGMDSSKTWCASTTLRRRSTTQSCNLAGTAATCFLAAAE